MPIINTLPRKPKSWRRKQTDKRAMRQKAYNSSDWKKLREIVLIKHPMCQVCEQRPAGQVHHLHSPFKGDSVDREKFLDEKNLIAVCSECHGNIHSGKLKLEDGVYKERITIPDEEEIGLDCEIV